jgi:uncharacterized membrane protein (Fun14 family)
VFFGFPLRGMFGSACGFCTGYYVKVVSRKLVFYAGLGLFGIYFLSHMGYITVNWRKIDKDFMKLLRGGRAHMGFTEVVKRFFTHVIPLAGAFGASFYYALKYM